MKQPAFMFYSGDFLSGVADLTMEERGQYITLLCLQHQKGRLSEKAIRLNIGEVSKDVIAKFEQDDDGYYYNERLKNEIGKREKFCKKQKEKVDKRWGNDTDSIPDAIPNSYQTHTESDTKSIPIIGNTFLEDENENENEDEIVNGAAKEVVEYLNKRIGAKYSAKTKATLRHINARFNEGYTLTDFKTVVDKKHAEWQGTDLEKFLRPETLFGTKFEGYLNQKAVKRKPQSFKELIGDEL